MGDLIETGDPDNWPVILDWYRNSDERWRLLSQISVFWSQHLELVAPILKEALKEPKDYDYALEAASYFPELVDDVVVSLSVSELRNSVTENNVLGSLGYLLGCLGHPSDYEILQSEERRREIFEKIAAEFSLRYGKDIRSILPDQ